MSLKSLENSPPWTWPETAAAEILAALRDPSAPAADRLVASELAGESVVVDDAMALALLAVASNPEEDDELRSSAAISLGPVLEQADLDGFDDAEDSPISKRTFDRIRESMRRLYLDAGVPKEVRRRILEASVRAPQDWHRDAIRAAFSSGDPQWQVSAVFGMAYVRGFEAQVLQALASDRKDLKREAVRAAGGSEVDAAWPVIAEILSSRTRDKALLLAALEAAAAIRPSEAIELLHDFTDSPDPDVAGTASEALAMAEGLAAFEADDFEDDEDDPDEEEPEL